MSYNFKSEVTNALGELLKTEANYDVIIYIGKQPDLCCRSHHFNKILSTKRYRKKTGYYSSGFRHYY